MSADITFDPSEWITLSEAAEIVRIESNSTDGFARWVLLQLLQQVHEMARVIAATLPALAIGERALERLPVGCQWVSAEIDWLRSEVLAFPFLSGTDWEIWYPPDRMLGVRALRTKLIEIVGQKHAPRSIQEIEALPSSTLRWLYELLPPPPSFEAKFNNWAERELAKRILANRDRERPAAQAQAPALVGALVLDWQPLATGIACLKAVGIHEDQAKPTLCKMIEDKRVAVRLTIAEGTSDIAGMFIGPNIEVPAHLQPTDFDWQNSRPFPPWMIWPYLLQKFSPKPRPVSRIDIHTRDIVRWAEMRLGALRYLGEANEPMPCTLYVSDWVRLSEALQLIIATTVATKHWAKAALCNAISDQKIRVRFLVAKSDGPGLAGERVINEVRPGNLAEVPLHLKPNNFDWRQSRPVKPWLENRQTAFFEQEKWHLDWIELFRADVMNVLCSGKQQRNDKTKLYRGSNGHRDHQAREWRAGRIRRFTENQKRIREWINFAEIAEWCSELSGSVVPDDRARASSYEKLQRDLLEGDFEEKGRARVLYLHPWTVMARMTRGRLLDLMEHYPLTTIRSQYLDHCWVPRKLFQRWLAKHEMLACPQRFEPKVEALSDPLSSEQADSPALKPATNKEIWAAIKAAYDAADAAGTKPPNIRELPAAVLPRLEEKGFRASARMIQEVGEAPEFKRRRRQPGKTISSERRARQN